MNKMLLRFLCFLLGGIFLYAGIQKLGEPYNFEVQIEAYRLILKAWIPNVAAILPVLEMLTGGWLLAGRNVRPALLSALLMLLIFTGALISLVIRGIEIDCGCFGFGGSTGIWSALGRDLVLLAIIVPAYLTLLNMPHEER